MYVRTIILRSTSGTTRTLFSYLYEIAYGNPNPRVYTKNILAVSTRIIAVTRVYYYYHPKHGVYRPTHGNLRRRTVTREEERAYTTITIVNKPDFNGGNEQSGRANVP